MLVRVQDDGVLAIGQLSHSWLSGQLARAWGNERFPAPEPREQIALGAEQHDIGWAQFDLRPQLSAEGRPRSFLETSVEEHLEIWRTAPERLLSQSELAALVVSLHGRSLSELRLTAGREGEEEPLRSHIDAEQQRQRRLRGNLGLSEQSLHTIRRQMWTWDGLSLALCNGWDPFTARDVPAAGGLADIDLRAGADGTHTLDPWPFEQERVELRCEGRLLAPAYDDEAALRRAFQDAVPRTLAFTLVRGGA